VRVHGDRPTWRWLVAAVLLVLLFLGALFWPPASDESQRGETAPPPAPSVAVPGRTPLDIPQVPVAEEATPEPETVVPSSTPRPRRIFRPLLVDEYRLTLFPGRELVGTLSARVDTWFRSDERSPFGSRREVELRGRGPLEEIRVTLSAPWTELRWSRTGTDLFEHVFDEEFGGLRGTLVDADGAVVPSFWMPLERARGYLQDGLTGHVRTDSGGAFSFDALPAGTWWLGFEDVRVDVEVRPGERTRGVVVTLPREGLER